LLLLSVLFRPQPFHCGSTSDALTLRLGLGGESEDVSSVTDDLVLHSPNIQHPLPSRNFFVTDRRCSSSPGSFSRMNHRPIETAVSVSSFQLQSVRKMSNHCRTNLKVSNKCSVPIAMQRNLCTSKRSKRCAVVGPQEDLRKHPSSSSCWWSKIGG